MTETSCDFSKFSISDSLAVDKGVEFALKFAVTSLCLAKHHNDDSSLAHENLSLEISFDRHVIAMENIETNGLGQTERCYGAEMRVEASSNVEFADKLASHPLLFRLIQRSKVEIGSQTLRPSDRFVNSSKSKTFSCETLRKQVNIIGGDGRVNAKLSLILLIEKTSQVGEETSSSSSSTTASLCQQRKEIEKVSSLSSRSKTAIISIPQKSIKRVCSECFDDLSVLPGDAKCPKCEHQRRVHEEIAHSKLIDKMRKLGNVNIEKCIKSALEELLLGVDKEMQMKQRACRTKLNRKSNFITSKRARTRRKSRQQR